MPRSTRRKSQTGIYHVMIRGINRQRIFEDNEDSMKILQTISDYKEKCGLEIYAYCLMSNHIHLLLKEGNEDLGLFFKRIGASYVYWYNLKYNRTGHLFQDRYKSEAVEDTCYFLTVLRYIHQNPNKAGIEKDVRKYPWSSYNEYIDRKVICDTTFALSLFSDDENKARSIFEKYNLQENNDKCLEYEQAIKLNDSEASEIIKKSAGVTIPCEIQNLEKEKRNKVIGQLKNKGLSIRQIERLTGVSFAVIREL